MKLLYLDLGMGAAGDMLTAALLELLPDREAFLEELNGIGLPNVVVSAEPAVKRGITGTHVSVKIHGVEENEEISHEHTHEYSYDHPHDHEHEHSHDHRHDHKHEQSHNHPHGHDHHHSSIHDADVYDEAWKIGEGTHERFVVQSDQFYQKTRSKISGVC